MYLKKYSEIYNATPIVAAPFRRKGEFRLVLRNSMGGIVQDTGWFPNLVTDTGLVHMAVGGTGGLAWFSNCHVGSSSTAPATTDTALVSWLGVHTSGKATTYGPTPVAPNYERWQQNGWRFAAGVATGTIRELGLSFRNYNADMSVRALVSPAVAKAADQVLDVYYRLTIWPNTGDVTGTTTIAGESYNYIVRPSYINSATWACITSYGPYTSAAAHKAYGGVLGTVTGEPTVFDNSTGDNGYSDSINTTGIGSGYCDWQAYWGLDSANDYGQVTAFRTPSTLTGATGSMGWQISTLKVSDGSGIPKDVTKEMYLDFRMTWARH